MAPLPTIVLVHGTWHSPECWDPVRTRLEGLGYPCVAIALKTVGATAPHHTLLDDSAYIHEVVEALADEGKEVVMALHSYGGIVGADGVRGLEKGKRQREGKEGGVVSLVMLCTFFRPEGYSPLEFFGSAQVDWWEVEGELFVIKEPERILYNDLDAEDAKYWSSKLRPSRFAEDVATTYAGWRYLPVFYLLCENDNAVLPEWQEWTLEMARNEGVDVTVARCNSSHSPMLSMPDFTTSFIRQAAGEPISV